MAFQAFQASMAVDVDGDGRPDYIVSGADRDGDGIPDALQQVCSQPTQLRRVSGVSVAAGALPTSTGFASGAGLELAHLWHHADSFAGRI